MSAEINYYDLLNIAHDAPDHVITAVYRAHMKKSHPDVSGSENDDDAKLIAEAYETLSDPSRRAEYDRTIRQRTGSSTSSSDMPSDPIGRQRPHTTRTAPRERWMPPSGLPEARIVTVLPQLRLSVIAAIAVIAAWIGVAMLLDVQVPYSTRVLMCGVAAAAGGFLVSKADAVSEWSLPERSLAVMHLIFVIVVPAFWAFTRFDGVLALAYPIVAVVGHSVIGSIDVTNLYHLYRSNQRSIPRKQALTNNLYGSPLPDTWSSLLEEELAALGQVPGVNIIRGVGAFSHLVIADNRVAYLSSAPVGDSVDTIIYTGINLYAQLVDGSHHVVQEGLDSNRLSSDWGDKDVEVAGFIALHIQTANDFGRRSDHPDFEFVPAHAVAERLYEWLSVDADPSRIRHNIIAHACHL